MYDRYVLWLRRLLTGTPTSVPLYSFDRGFAGAITLALAVALIGIMFIATTLALMVLS